MKAIKITPGGQIEDVEINTYEDLSKAIGGWIEPVNLATPEGQYFTMYVDEEYRLKHTLAVNVLAMQLSGMCGRVDLMYQGILGPVVLLGPVDGEGDDTSVTPSVKRTIQRLVRSRS